MNKNYNTGFRAGLAFGCAKEGVSATTLRKSAACVKECTASAPVQIQLAKIASHICRAAGPEFVKTAAIYDAIVAREGVYTSLAREMYIEPVVHTLSGLQKNAGILTDTASAIGAGQDVLYKAMLLGALGGAGVGTLGWTLLRDVKEDDATAEVKHEQAKMYRRIAKDLQKRIDAQASADKDTKKLRKTIEEEEAGNYVL